MQEEQQQSAQPKKSKKWYIIGGIIAVAIIGSFVGKNDDKNEKQKSEIPVVAVKEVKPTEKTEAAPPRASLGLTIDQFEERYNRFVGEYNNGLSNDDMRLAMLKIDRDKINAGQTNNVCTTENTCLLLFVSNEGNYLKEVMALANGTGTFTSGAVAMFHMIVTSSAAIPSATMFNTTSGTIISLMDKASKNEKKKKEAKAEIISDGYKLVFYRSGLIGNTLSIQKAKK